MLAGGFGIGELEEVDRLVVVVVQIACLLARFARWFRGWCVACFVGVACCFRLAFMVGW